MPNSNAETVPSIQLMKARRFKEIPIDKIKVLNSRTRESQQFEMNVQSINSVGLLKPIRVNDKFYSRCGYYELICGQGRLISHERLNQKTIWAEVVTCSRKDAYLQSLIENLARRKPKIMEFARELKRLHDAGWDYSQIAKIACRSEEYIRQFICLVEQGEDRLIQGVEHGIIPISFAVQVAQSDQALIQNLLIDAFDEGLVNTSNFAAARKIINNRLKDKKFSAFTSLSGQTTSYTVKDLKEDICHATEAKNSFVCQASEKENRFLILFNGINTLFRDKTLFEMLESENLMRRPDLSGDYEYEPTH